MTELAKPLVVGFFVFAVVSLSVLYQRKQFRRTGDPPDWTFVHALIYGVCASVFSVLTDLLQGMAFWIATAVAVVLVFAIHKMLRHRRGSKVTDSTTRRAP